MRDFIAFVMGNFTLTFFVLGLIASAIALAFHRGPRTSKVVVETLFKWFLFFSIGISYLYNAVFHTVFGEMTAKLIGWADSPFQLEVGFASLGFGAVGLLAPWRSFDMRLAAVLGPALFLWGAAGGHIYQMVAAAIMRRAMPGSCSTAISWRRSSASRSSGCSAGRDARCRNPAQSPHSFQA